MSVASTIGLDSIREHLTSAPTDEVLRRYADQSPSWLIPRLVATQQLRQMFADVRQRTADSHRCHMRALGMEDVMSKDATADVGDINIKGDTFYLGPEQQATATSPVTNGLKKFLLPTILGGALLGGGAGAMALYNYLTDKPDSVTEINNPAQDWELGISVSDSP